VYEKIVNIRTTTSQCCREEEEEEEEEEEDRTWTYVCFLA
jgi:hypothetical protein